MRKNKLLLLLALLMTAATGAWGMQIYISYPSWPTGTNVNGDGNLVLEMEASDSFENMKAKIEDKSGLNPDYMKLYFNSVEMANNETLNAKGVTSNSVLTLVYTPPLYTVTMAEGTVDAANWTISPTEAAEGKPITATYSGTKHVKSVTAVTKAAATNTAPSTANIDAYTGGAFAWSGGETTATFDVTINTFAAGDGISILSDKNTNTKFTTSEGGATASFTGTATDGDPTYFALYPYTAGLTLDGTTIQNVVIPETQNVSTTAWDKSAAIAYATTSGSSLTFHNACALLKITNDSGDDTWITISAFNPGVLTGTFNLDTSTGAFTIQSGIKRVRAKNVPNNTTIYLAIAPCTLSSGFMANWSNPMTGNDGDKDKMGSVTFEAGKIYDLGKTSDWHH